MPADRLEGVALVTGGGRGIGASISRELAAAGMHVAVTGRTPDTIEAVANEIGGLALAGDVSREEDVKRWVETIERDLGPIELLVCNAGIGGSGKPFFEEDPEEWWHVFEVNVLGAYLCCRIVGERMAERGRGRIVNIGSGGSYLPITNARVGLGTPYGASKAALGRFSETLAAALQLLEIHVFLISPGLVRTDMTESSFGADAPWTPPELAPRLVRVLASGRADEIVADDLNAIRLRR